MKQCIQARKGLEAWRRERRRALWRGYVGEGHGANTKERVQSFVARRGETKLAHRGERNKAWR